MKKKKKVIIGAIILAIIFVLILTVKAFLKTTNDMVVSGDAGIVAEALSKHDMSSSVSAVGTVESQNVVSVTSELTYQIKELKVALGDYVEAGQVLCVFDDTDLKSQIDTLEKQLSTSEALAAKQSQIAKRELEEAKENQTSVLENKAKEIDNIKNQLAAAQANYDKEQDEIQKATYAAQVTDFQSRLTTANTEYSELEQSTAQAIQSAQDTVDTNALSSSSDSSTEKELAKLYRQQDELTVTAEQSGIITSLNVSQGSIPNGVLMVISDNQNLQVSVSINESDIAKLGQGMSAVITASAIDDKTVGGSVSRVLNFTSGSSGAGSAAEANAAGGTSSGYSAVIKVDQGSGLLLGMSVKVEIVTKEAGEEEAVAYDSILTNDDGGTYVYKAEDQGNGKYKVVKVDVTVGDKSDYYTAISSENLKSGDLIIGSPDMVTEGDVISISNVSDAISQDLNSNSGTE